MGKKTEIPILSPGECLRSLTEYHQNVVALIGFIRAIRDEIPKQFHDMLDRNVEAVNKFYNQ